MTRSHLTNDILNGAQCYSYSWSQSHSDLEIHVNLMKVVKYENVNMTISTNSIEVELINQEIEHNQGCTDCIDHKPVNTKQLIEGKFEHSVNTESAFWLLDNDKPCIVIYLDKVERMWWKQLLLDEQVAVTGPRNYSVLIDHLDDGSRMAIDKIIVEQRNKISNNGGSCSA